MATTKIDFEKTRRMNSPKENLKTVDSLIGFKDFVENEIQDEGVYLELGTYRGISASALSDLRPNLQIYTVDINPRSEAAENFKERKNITQIIGRSPDVVLSRFSEVDYLYLDTAHHFNQVFAELEALAPLVTKAVCGHDYFCRFPGVAKAVFNYFQNPPHRVYEDTSWAFRLQK